MGGTAGIPFVDNPAANLGPVQDAQPTAAPTAAAAPTATVTPAATQPAATPAQPTVATTPAVNVAPDGTVAKPGIASRFYHGFLSALGGANDVQLQRDPQTGQMTATAIAKTPGAQWKSIIAAGMAGLAGASNVAPGPGNIVRGAGAGIEAGTQLAKQATAQKVQAANENYDATQQALVRKAQLQKMAVETAGASFSLEQSKAEASAFDSKLINDHMNWLRDNGGSDIGTFKNFDEVAQHAQDNPTLAADIAHGRVAVVPNIEQVKNEDGTTHLVVTGIRAAVMPENWGQSLNDKDLPIERMVPGKNGAAPTWETETVPAGTMKNSDYNAAVLATVNQKTKMESDRVENDLKRAQTKTQAAEQAAHYAEATKSRAEAAALGAGEGSPIEAQAKMIVDGQLDPSQLSKKSASYGATLAAANAYSLRTYGKAFDPAKAQGDYKFATNPQTYNTLNFLNSLTGRDDKSGNLGTVVQMSDKLGQGKFPPLNDVAQWAKLNAGNPEIAAYHAALTETSDQIAKILQGGGSGNGTSDAKMKQAGQLLDKGFNGAQIRDTANTLRTLLAHRKQEIIGDNRYLQRWHGTPAPNPGQLPGGVQPGEQYTTGPKGTVVLRNNQWVDPLTGKAPQ